MLKTITAIIILFAPSIMLAQETDLIPTGKGRIGKQAWILLDSSRYVKGEQQIEVQDSAIADRAINYVAFYVDGALVAVDEVPPYVITHDFGSYTHKSRIVAIGVRYEIEAAEVQSDDTAESGLQAPDERDLETDSSDVAVDVDAGALRITSPTSEEYAYGVKLISAEVGAPLDRILRVDFSVDGQLVGSAGAPPYEIEHDFGRGFEGRTILVSAVLADGRRLTQEMQTRPLEGSDYFIRTRLVTLEATVVDWRDRLVGDLKQDEFRVFENGDEQTVSHFSVEERPLRVAMLIDTSGSMRHRGRMGRAISAARQFLDFLKPEQDKAAVISFTDQINVLSRFTNDFGGLKKKIGELEPEGGTAINDALDLVAPMFEDETGRKAIVLVSDGYDENSDVSINEAVESVKRAGIKVYSIAIFETMIIMEEMLKPPPTRRGKEPDFDPEDVRKSNRPLDKNTDPRKILFIGLADETGGAVFFPQKQTDLPLAFQRIAEELRHMYSIGYMPSNTDFDGRWRKIAVKTTRGGLTVRTKKGYYAEN